MSRMVVWEGFTFNQHQRRSMWKIERRVYILYFHSILVKVCVFLNKCMNSLILEKFFSTVLFVSTIHRSYHYNNSMSVAIYIMNYEYHVS